MNALLDFFKRGIDWLVNTARIFFREIFLRVGTDDEADCVMRDIKRQVQIHAVKQGLGFLNTRFVKKPKSAITRLKNRLTFWRKPEPPKRKPLDLFWGTVVNLTEGMTVNGNNTAT